jgi:hypothetical protein
LTDGSTPTFRNFFVVADHFSSLPAHAKEVTCAAWIRALRQTFPTVTALRVYRVVQELVPRSQGRPSLPPTRTLAFTCSGSTTGAS